MVIKEPRLKKNAIIVTRPEKLTFMLRIITLERDIYVIAVKILIKIPKSNAKIKIALLKLLSKLCL